ncbi:DUF1385 domain-containing protein [Evansella cellulosilytica]|uniref:DUF1385 domain-containing protein n=1 Tax=Evansella cellulosilytica (strain ATCC 21833 / DSM 2522 / FERM P-1141 / JCM 9156 / N-4) TaxID=649639 RepID=E6TTE3_EVAC2|nr:DUF1385 domain-containing protein [Evansella cellulosilytica]ADU28483.1 protein of unknown function DUF1385 [Evansella cellulosilytica DSM 2522]
MEVYGGRAGYNSVCFKSERYKVISRWENGGIKTKTTRKKGKRKLFFVLSKVPFVRAFSFIFELLMEYWGYVLSVFMIVLLLQIKLFESFKSYSIPISPLVLLLVLLLISGLFIKVTPIGKYHAAEHMVARAYEIDGGDLSIEKVRQHSRIHKNCGTNLVTSILIFYICCFFIIGDGIWVLLVSWGIGYELWKSEPKGIWNIMLVIGGILQYYLFTSKPDDRHLLVAIEAMRVMEEQESNSGKNKGRQ